MTTNQQDQAPAPVAEPSGTAQGAGSKRLPDAIEHAMAGLLCAVLNNTQHEVACRKLADAAGPLYDAILAELRTASPAPALTPPALGAPASEDDARWRFLARDPECFRALYDLFGELYVSNTTGDIRTGLLRDGVDAADAMRATVDAWMAQDEPEAANG